MTQCLHPIDIYAGEQLRALRKIKNISQAELGNRLSKPITFQQVQKYERGVNRMSISRAYEFAEILDVSVITFFPEEDREALPVLSKQEGKILYRIKSLPESHQASLLALIKEMSKNYGREIPE